MGDKNDILILTAEDGREVELEFLDSTIYDNKVFVALLPVVEEEKMEIVIMEVKRNEEGVDEFYPVGDESELEAVFNEFRKRAQVQFNSQQ